MSIYGSTFTAGEKWVRTGGNDRIEVGSNVTSGDVLVRGATGVNEGGRNDYPHPDRFTHGTIDGAAIPAFCVPGHNEEHPDGSACEGYEAPGGWYRLGANVEGGPYVEMLLNEKAARKLQRDLKRWLKLPKTQPTGEGEDVARD